MTDISILTLPDQLFLRIVLCLSRGLKKVPCKQCRSGYIADHHPLTILSLFSMMISLFPIILFASLPCVLAASRPVSYADPVHVPILRRSNVSDRVANLPKVIEAVRHKYGFATTTISKRSGDARSGYIPLASIVSRIWVFPPQDGVRQLSAK